MTASAARDPQTALESLAAALDPGEFITTLVTGPAAAVPDGDQPPRWRGRKHLRWPLVVLVGLGRGKQQTCLSEADVSQEPSGPLRRCGAEPPYVGGGKCGWEQ